MCYRIKENGHPVPSKDIGFIDQEKLYNKEASDVRTHYSIILPLSSNQNYRTARDTPCRRCKYPDETRQAVYTDLSQMRSPRQWCSQLDTAQGSGLERGHSPNLDCLLVSQSVLSALSQHPDRGSGTLSSVSAGNRTYGPIRLSAMSVDDCNRCGPTPGPELENSQSHRQILSGTRFRKTRFKRVKHLSRGRNIDPQRPSLPNRRTGLSQRPRCFCRQGSQSRNPGTFFQSTQRRAA